MAMVIQIDDLTLDQVQKMTSHLKHEGAQMPSDIEEILYRHASGSVYLTQLILENLWERNISDLEIKISEADIDVTVETIIAKSTENNHFINMYNAITDYPLIQQGFLQVIAGQTIDKSLQETLRLIGIIGKDHPFRNTIYARVFGAGGPLEIDSPKKGKIYLFGDYELNTYNYTLCQAGQIIRLRPKEFQLLHYLLEHHDRVVSKEELSEKVWYNQFVSDMTLKSSIDALRRALGDSSCNQQIICSFRDYGYRFTAPVVEAENLQLKLTSRPVPDEAPILMPVQKLDQWDAASRVWQTPRHLKTWIPRARVFTATLALTTAASYEMYQVLSTSRMTVIQVALLIVFAVNFVWIALSFVSGFAGFIALWRRRVVSGIAIPPLQSTLTLKTRTALLMPIYNEVPQRIFAGVQAMYESLEDLGMLEHFDFFILRGYPET